MAKVLLKRSSVVGKAPDSSDLEFGELALNYADGKLYYKNSSNEINYFIDSDLIKTYVDAQDDLKVSKAGDTMSGALNMGNNGIINLASPISGTDAANKAYVDDVLSTGLTTPNYPVGDYGRVDSANGFDAFGVAISRTYDHMDPTGSLVTVEHGTDSSI